MSHNELDDVSEAHIHAGGAAADSNKSVYVVVKLVEDIFLQHGIELYLHAARRYTSDFLVHACPSPTPQLFPLMNMLYPFGRVGFGVVPASPESRNSAFSTQTAHMQHDHAHNTPSFGQKFLFGYCQHQINDLVLIHISSGYNRFRSSEDKIMGEMVD
ncbi:hypothetical protein T10_5497 [Trichinella papuae]|uniref:Uncharacterized protein n=1 Tax=Trichinella papuae TaxID=268474 RepID=A0A0V1MI68_9BILA|nr:hypothetical protein T10_5497 [Trichinella papuae]